jgi:hypothetical protein
MFLKLDVISVTKLIRRFCALLALLLILMAHPPYRTSPLVDVYNLVQSLFSVDRITVEGLSPSAELSLRSALPSDRSALWWLWNRAKIKASVLQHPEVSRAIVARDDSCWFRCYKIVALENKARFVTLLAERPWILGEEGEFLKPLSPGLTRGEVEQVLARSRSSLVLVDGLIDESHSPDFTKARLQYLNKFIPTVESESRLKVKSVALNAQGDIEIKFRSLPMVAVFDYAGIDVAKAGHKARRLGIVLQELQDRILEISKVDLSFDKEAVVTFIP